MDLRFENLVLQEDYQHAYVVKVTTSPVTPLLLDRELSRDCVRLQAAFSAPTTLGSGFTPSRLTFCEKQTCVTRSTFAREHWKMSMGACVHFVRISDKSVLRCFKPSCARNVREGEKRVLSVASALTKIIFRRQRNSDGIITL
ncbi:MAG: hypothetical protein Q9210_003099 [Variospora velana]